MTTLDTIELGTAAQAVTDLLTEVADAWAANDADASAALYTPDATVVTAGSIMSGRDAIRSFLAGAFAGPLRGTSLSEEDRQVRLVGDDVAIVNSRSAILQPGEQVARPEMRRLATWVAVRAGGAWLVASYHNCDA
ncbi:MAG: SgcJ/EcaC family oxidoreductase [Brevundimonas sp.]